MRDRLIELIEKWYEKPTTKYLADTILADNWVRLPCKVGDTLYDITEFLDGTSHPEIYELQDVEMMIEKNIYGEYIFTYDDCYICSDKIGISLFPTKEEAVQALKGVKE